MINFHELQIGEKFHAGKYLSGFDRINPSTMIYQKISKSKGQCVEQINYGNTRLESKIFAFAPFQTVWKVG